MPMDLEQSDGGGRGGGAGDQHDQPSSNGGGSGKEPLHEGFRRISSTFVSCMPGSSSSLEPSPASSRRRSLLMSSSMRASLRRLDSSARLSVTCSGSDLGQLYLSSPEQDALQLLSPGAADDERGEGPHRRSSWLRAADVYGRRRSFRRMGSYARFLDAGWMSEISEEEDEERILLIEEADGPLLGKRFSGRRCMRQLQSPAVVVPFLMVLDLVLGVSLSLYDSNLLRNVPGFRFPLCYALVQKLTNALASLVLICLTRRWETKEMERRQRRKPTATSDGISLTALPSFRTFRWHMVPLSAVALVQTISAACANKALQIVPLPLFKVCLMCGPIFVALIASVLEGKLYSKGRLFALSLIGIGACRAVYAEAEGADNPRYIMEGAGYALGASAFSGIGLVLSSVLMHRDGSDEDESETANDPEVQMDLNPLSLLFYLSCEQVLMLGAYLSWDAFVQSEEGSETEAEYAGFAIYVAEDPSTAAFYLMTGSGISLLLAVLTFVLVNKTSPVATSLLGNARSIATVAISSVVYGNAGGGGLFGSAAFGYSLTLAGGVAYALAALRNEAFPAK